MTGRGLAPVYLWLAFFAACVAIAWQAHFTADLSAFLPRSPTPSQRILVDQIREGVASRLILVGLESAEPEKLVQMSNVLAGRLANLPEFAYVNNGAAERVEADGRYLMEHRYLLSPGVTPERFTVAGLRAALEEDLELLASPMGSLVGRLLPQDPTGEFLRLLELFQLEGGPPKRDGVWFSDKHGRAVLIAQTRAPGFDTDAQQHALDQLQAQFAGVSSQFGAPLARLIGGGPGVFAVATRASIERDVSRISLLAVLLVSCLLLVVYRSPRVLVLTLLPVATGAAAGVAAVSVAFGSVHGITLGFGATLLGEGVDYAIYLFTSVAASPLSSSSSGWLWRTLRLGVLTSVVGFGVMLLSDFSGLAQLGLFSITGLIVAFAVTRVVLPRLMRAGYRAQPLAALGPALLRIVSTAPRLRYPLIGLVVLCAAGLAMRSGALWDDRLESLSPVPDADKRAYAQLQSDLSAPDARYLVVAAANSSQTALETAEDAGAVLDRLQQADVLTGFDSPARILPSDRTQQRRQQQLPDGTLLRSNLREAARGTEFRVDLFEPFVQAVANAEKAPLLRRADLAGTGLEIRLDSLLAQRRDGWLAMLSLRGVKDARVVGAGLEELRLTSLHLLDVKQEAEDLYRNYRGQAIRFALIGAAAIALLLLATLRSARRAAAVLVPLVAALVVASAALSLAGRLTMFHLIGMLLVVGVGSNYTLFFEAETFAAGDAQRTATSVVLCNACTVIGFGLLGLASAPVLRFIGVTVALGAFLSLVFAAILRSEGVKEFRT